MPTFMTPEPITVTMDLFVAGVRIIASDRADTIVEVHPRNGSRSADIKAAELASVEYSDGRLSIKGPKQRIPIGIGGRGAIAVTIEVPAGSHVHGESAGGEIRGEGRLGECQFKIAAGNISLDQTGALNLNTASGDITVERVEGNADVVTGSGAVQIREIVGRATIKNANGGSSIGDVTGELRLNAANGDISIGRAHASILAKTANGHIRVNEVMHGSVQLETAHGEVEVGIREGTAAWLDVVSQHGSVRNSLKAEDGPRQSDETVEMRARTVYGDIIIRRSVRIHRS